MGIKTNFRTSFYLSIALGFAALAITPAMRAQSRVNDKDVEGLMSNLKDDAKSFRPKFNDAVHKSSIRRTSREKDAKRLAERFEKETDAMLKQFKKNKKSDTELRVVMSTASQIDQVVANLQLGGQVSERWSKIQSELRHVERAFGLQGFGGMAAIDAAPQVARGTRFERIGAE